MRVPTTLSLRPSTSKSTQTSQTSADTMPQPKRSISQTFALQGEPTLERHRLSASTADHSRPSKERKMEASVAHPDLLEATNSTYKKLIRKASTATARSMRSRLSLSQHFNKPARHDTAARDSSQSLYAESTQCMGLHASSEVKSRSSLREKLPSMKRRRGGASGPSGEEGHWNPSAAPLAASYLSPAFNLDPLGGQSAKASVAAYNNVKASDSGTSLVQLDEDDHICLPDDSMVKMDFVAYLPTELTLEIFSNLDLESLGRAELVSKAWNNMATSQAVWQRVFRQKYESKVHVSPAPIQMGGPGVGQVIPGQNWKQMMQARRTIERRWAGGNPAATYFNGHTDSVYCCQFDEEKIITGSRDRTIRVWDIETKKCIRVIGGPSSLPVAPTTPSLPTIPNHTVSDLPTLNGTLEGRAIFDIPTDYHSQSILCLQYDDELMVTGSSDTTCIVWDVKTFKPLRRLRRHNAGVLDVCLDTRFIISCSKDSTICVWDRYSDKLLNVFNGHTGPVNAVQLRGNLLVSASGDGMAKLWSLETGECIKDYPSKDGGLAAVEFSDDAKHVLAGGNNQVVYKFDATTGQHVHTYKGHGALVRSLFVDAPNNVVVSGSYDQSIRVYNYTNGENMGLYENWTTSWILSAKSDFRRIVCTSQDGRAVLLDFGHNVHGVNLLKSKKATTV